MSRYRRSKTSVDANQGAIVETLRMIPGVSVETDHDDVLVGYRGRTYWYEIKTEAAIKCMLTPGRRKKVLMESQARLKDSWRGHYRIVSTAEEVLGELGIGR